jgi:hypothetical protein
VQETAEPCPGRLKRWSNLIPHFQVVSALPSPWQRTMPVVPCWAQETTAEAEAEEVDALSMPEQALNSHTRVLLHQAIWHWPKCRRSWSLLYTS